MCCSIYYVPLHNLLYTLSFSLPASAEAVDGGGKLRGKGSPALSGNKVMKRKSFSAARRIDATLKVK